MAVSGGTPTTRSIVDMVTGVVAELLWGAGAAVWSSVVVAGIMSHRDTATPRTNALMTGRIRDTRAACA